MDIWSNRALQTGKQVLKKATVSCLYGILVAACGSSLRLSSISETHPNCYHVLSFSFVSILITSLSPSHQTTFSSQTVQLGNVKIMLIRLQFWKRKLLHYYTRVGYWQGLHDMIHITIHWAWFDYITIHYDTKHTAIFHIVHWKCKNRVEIQVAVYDLGSLNTSHQIILIIQQTNWVKTILFKIYFPIYMNSVGKFPNTLCSCHNMKINKTGLKPSIWLVPFGKCVSFLASVCFS